MKLSDPQRRNLATLVEAFLKWTRAGVYGTRTNTLDSLVALGLAERRIVYGTLDYEYRAVST